MPVAVVVSFIVIFALILLAVSVGLKFFDARRKKQVADMLQTAAGEPVVTITNLLKEIDPDKPTGFKALLQSLQFSRHAQEQIQQAGLTWSPTRLLAAMGSGDGPGLGPRRPAPVHPERTDHRPWSWRWSVGAAAVPVSCATSARSGWTSSKSSFPRRWTFWRAPCAPATPSPSAWKCWARRLADPLGQEFRTLFNEQNLGAPLEIALRNFTERVPLLDVRFFTSSVLLQKQTGGNLSEILSRLAYVIRERFRLKGQVKAASAHGRLTATILTLLPVATMLGLLVVAPGYLQGMARRSGRQVDDRRRDRGPDPGQFLHQEDHQHQGVIWIIQSLFSICAFLMLMLLLTWVGYRMLLQARPSSCGNSARPVITDSSAWWLTPTASRNPAPWSRSCSSSARSVPISERKSATLRS